MTSNSPVSREFPDALFSIVFTPFLPMAKHQIPQHKGKSICGPLQAPSEEWNPAACSYNVWVQFTIYICVYKAAFPTDVLKI